MDEEISYEFERASIYEHDESTPDKNGSSKRDISNNSSYFLNNLQMKSG